MKPDEYKENKKRMNFWEAMSGDKTTLAETLNAYRPWPRTKKRESFYPSDAERCERALFWALKGEPESNAEFSDEQLNIFGLGDSIERSVAEKYKRLPGHTWEGVGGGYYLPGYEDPDTWDPDTVARPKITYYMDIVWHDEDGLVLDEPMDIIVEVKSIAQFPFHSSRNKHREYTWYGAEDIPKTDHYTQVQMYMWGEKKEYGIVHYYSKNDGAEKVWLVTIDYDYLAELFARLESVYHAVVADELPDRPYMAYPSRDNTRLLKGTKIDGQYRKTYWRCNYCGYASKCWKLKGYEDKEEDE